MFQKITRINLDKFLEKHATEKRVLDIGSGGSSYGRYFPNRLTVDIDPARKPEIVADAQALPFKDGEFEMVLCTEVLEHTKKPQQVIDELERVLSKGGKIILTTRFNFPLHDTPGDYWRFTRYGLLELFKKWKVEEIRSETKTFSAIAVLLQRIAFQTKLRVNKFSKFILMLISFAFSKADFLLVEEFGDIKRNNPDREILTTGYYVLAYKK